MKKLYTVIALLMVSAASHAQESSTGLRLSAKRLTNVRDSYPVQSPDGTKILFQSNRTNYREIFVMNVDSANVIQLTNNKGPNVTPVWSPDGKMIVFASERDGDSEIYVMNADGSSQRRLTNTPGDDSHPHWSPDGKRIIFNSARTTPDLNANWSRQIHEIFSMNADGSDVTQISRLKTVSTYPSYSPDGKKIAFRSVTNDAGLNWDLSQGKRNSEVFVMDSDGTNAVNLTKNAAFDGWPTWSPDSKRILFSSNRTGPVNTGQLYVVNVDGTNLQKITDGPGSIQQPSWSRDGKKIYAYQNWETETEEFGNLVEFKIPPL